MTYKELGIRCCLFRGTTRSNSGLFSCYCSEKQALAALNFIRFLD